MAADLRGSPTDYIAYHIAMLDSGDMDPAFAALLYICERFEFNVEQRYWIAFLYQACYNVCTAFFIWNEFPDCARVDARRLQTWWHANQHRLVFQTDRRWVKMLNGFCTLVGDYRRLVGDGQEAFFASRLQGDPSRTYDILLNEISAVRQVGRYSAYLWLEAVNTLTGYPVEPFRLDLWEGRGSSRNGLCCAYNVEDWQAGGYSAKRQRPPTWAVPVLEHALSEVIALARVSPATTMWNIETSLCAYKKLWTGDRYLGYYIDRQAHEIRQAETLITDGVDWQPFWDFRAGHYAPAWLIERRSADSGLDPRQAGQPEHWFQRGPMFKRALCA